VTRVRAQKDGGLGVSLVDNPANLVVCEGIPGVSVVGAYGLIEIIVEFITLSVTPSRSFS
jgi:hypothetical protein